MSITGKTVSAHAKNVLLWSILIGAWSQKLMPSALMSFWICVNNLDVRRTLQVTLDPVLLKKCKTGSST